MDRIVRIKTYVQGNVVTDTIIVSVDFSKCRVVKEHLENGMVIETYYKN